jgi:amino acid adenylation domain-containing protein
MKPHLHDQATPLLHDFLLAAAEERPNAVALVARPERISYAELERRSRELAAFFAARGIERGDRVVIFGENSIDVATSFWAALRANAVPIVVSPQTKRDKLRYLVDDCRARAIVADGPLWAGVAEALRLSTVELVVTRGGDAEETLGVVPYALARIPGAAAPPRRCLDIDLAAIIYTSGSTGEPKGVMHTHRSMITAATSVSSYLEMNETDVVLCALPLSFDYGLYQIIMAARVGASVVIERSFAYPAQVVVTMQEERVTGFPGVPTMFAMLHQMKSLWGMDWSNIRFVSNTAAALGDKQIQFLRQLFPAARVYSMYGLTECQRCTYLPPEDLGHKPGSVGVAIPNTELWLVDDQDRRLGPGEVGQLVIRGATVMRGYWEKPEATAAKLKPGPLPGEMVLYTGDLCRLDDDGYLYFVGRMDDIIKSRGEKVAPKEVETAIGNIEGVLETAVVGVPDPILGQAVKAYVVLEAGAELTAVDVQRACQARLEAFMVPKHVAFVASLPRTTTGKINKSEMV